MIKSFAHKGIEAFFRSGSKKGIQPHHADRLRIQLAALENATAPQDLDTPGWRLHLLKGDKQGIWSITVNGNWRMTFRFVNHNAELVDYLDYH